MAILSMQMLNPNSAWEFHDSGNIRSKQEAGLWETVGGITGAWFPEQVG
jgi:hypothetical protein